MRRLRILFMSMLGLTGCASDGDVKSVEIANFQYSACKSSATEPAPALLTKRTSEDYAGQECVAWQFGEAQRLDLDLINITAACGFPKGQGGLWKPRANLNGEGVLTVEIGWDFEYANACGSCLQDFSLSMALPSASQPLQVVFATRGANEEPWQSTTMPVDPSSAPGGIVCREAKQPRPVGSL